MTRRVVAGNWKMNNGRAATRAFFDAFSAKQAVDAGVEILIFPPVLSYDTAEKASPAYVRLGLQNVHFEASGAFTGELSVPMVKETAASHVLVGHSERRHIFHEPDAWVAAKTSAVLEAGLVPVVCVGETLDERRAGKVVEVILSQLEAVLPAFEAHPTAEVLVAYEPVWAIGTGETATPQDAADAHSTLRARLVSALGEARGGSIPILYGGSVKPGNAQELMEAAEVDGVLVGGASLDPGDFAAIAEAAAKTLTP